MRSLALFSVVYLFLLSAVSAWPNPYGIKLANLRRQDDTTAADSASAAATTEVSTATATATESAATATDEASSGTITGTATGTGTQTDKATKTGTTTSIDPRLPPGGISMITPNPYTTSYYKIGDYVTFAWNYTSLSVTPSAINVVASCSLNDATYTISSNMSVEETGAVTWDTGKHQASATVPLLTATYTLIIYDADKPMDYIAKSGHLSSSNQFQFGMYLPQKYTPLNEYKCATCNSALSDIDRQALKFAFAMIGITFASFAWFAGDFGVFST